MNATVPKFDDQYATLPDDQQYDELPDEQFYSINSYDKLNSHTNGSALRQYLLG